MIQEINRTNLESLRNPAMKQYIGRYLDIQDDFSEQIRSSGIEIDETDSSMAVQEKMEQLRARGAHIRNDFKSIYINRISEACETCRTGVGSATYFLSLKCHRDCFYCFNPNQEHYEYHRDHMRAVMDELDQVHKNHQKVRDLALTGGEPLLYKEETLAFFKQARSYYPKAYLRLYTSGDHVDEKILHDLQECKLDEIRFSIRLDDPEKGRQHTLDRIALSREYIPQVLVEMPVLPDTKKEMKALLVELEDLEIFGINLLEFCYPLNNADIFRSRGYKVKSHPFRVLYDYWYAGGLPIAGSEILCLELLEFAIDKGFKLGVHYCSLENKHTGQIYQQNTNLPVPRLKFLSPRDYFLKSAKVFGEDISRVKVFFEKKGYTLFEENNEYNYLEFPVSQVRALKNLGVQVGLCTSVYEQRGKDTVLRELKVDMVEPENFIQSKDI